MTLVPLLALLAGGPPAVAAPAEPTRPLVEAPPIGGDLVAAAARDLERIRRALKEVLARVQDARDEKDLVKLLCADEKLSRLKALVAVAERADVALAEAIAGRDAGAETESSKIAVARGKADLLRAEAAGCIGQLAFEVSGRTTVVVEESLDLPDAGRFSPADPFRTEFGLPSTARR